MNQNNSINTLLINIADKEILTSLFMNDYSLMNGQMGATIFFALLSRFTGNHWYEGFADELLGNICNNISLQLPLNFAYGLCGIGWGIEFLKYHGFIGDDTDEILSEIDMAVMERDLRRNRDVSLTTGLGGIYSYVFSRLDSKSQHTQRSIFDEKFLNELYTSMNKDYVNSEIYSIENIWNLYLESIACKQLISWRRGLIILSKTSKL